MRKTMKKDILMFGSLLSLMSVSGAALAQNCTSPTRCGELGYTLTASDCVGQRTLPCPFDSSKLWCAFDQEIGLPISMAKPGMIYYSDGSVSNEVIEGKTAVGVVGYINGTEGLLVSLNESTLTWGPYNIDVPCLINYSSAPEDMNGKENTECIMSQDGSYPAAQYCSEYKTTSEGIGSSGWYLPAAGELKALSKSYAAINTALKKLSKTQLNSSYYWSSSEYLNLYAWYVRPSDGDMNDNYDGKNYSYRVRCVLAF